MARKFQELRDKMSPARRAAVDARVKAEIEAMPLQRLRRAREFTQATLAEAMHTSQGEVSAIENRTDVYVSTLRRFIESMGGDLKIVASFPDGTDVEISQFEELATKGGR